MRYNTYNNDSLDKGISCVARLDARTRGCGAGNEPAKLHISPMIITFFDKSERYRRGCWQ
jgi:hypothetical protein